MVETNSLIKASAGTGKTYALATRFIRLMLIDGVDPETIVALTFSRAAAQEIYEKILDRLAEASKNDESAEKERKALLEDFENGAIPDAARKLAAVTARVKTSDAGVFRGLLRRLVDTQHLGTIATIDSFILRFIRNFPQEMGFQNAVQVLDPREESVAVDNALKRAMSGSGRDGEAIKKAFRKTKDGVFSRTCLKSISRILSTGWRNFALVNPECGEWTEESMCEALGVPLNEEPPDLSMLPVNEIKRKNTIAPEAAFIDLVNGYDGSESFISNKKICEMIQHFRKNPEETSWTYSFYGKNYVFDCGPEGAAAVHAAIRYMMNVYLKRKISQVRAKLDLVFAVENEYSGITRRAGKLTFSDFTTFTAENELSERGIAIRNLQFRFDSRFDHWALDEFQDTSELQWKCLRELVAEAAGDGYNDAGRTAMAVGDLKQSIYTWRGASATPFDEISSWPQFDGCVRDIKESYRYGPNITAFINAVFGTKNIAVGGVIPEVCSPAVENWAKGWVDHVSNRPPDYVKAIAVEPDEMSDDEEAILSGLCKELSVLWEKHEKEKSTDTVGVLVRTNTYGAKVAEHLRAHGLPAVWEGMDSVHDLPVIQAILALLKLSDHPEDTAAWRMVNDVYRVREKIFPSHETAAAVSLAVSRKLSRFGMARTLMDFREKLDVGIDGKSVASERMRLLVETASVFERRPGGGGSADEFIDFLRKAQKRETASSSNKIRVLSIHRSKGLGFDHVFVPLFEKNRNVSAIDRPKDTAPLFGGGSWVLPHLSKGLEEFNPHTKKAFDKTCSDVFRDALRTYYVAFTRAKKSMFIVFPTEGEDADSGKGLLIRDLIVQAVGTSFETGDYPTCKKEENKSDDEESHYVRDVWKNFGKRQNVERVSPSKTASFRHGGMRVTAASLLDPGYGSAARRGVIEHAWYEKIEWAAENELSRLPESMTEAFIKPSPEATVWRERGYEFFKDGRWETGQFDRVVFTGTGDNRSAVIYDFKTNAKRDSESDEEFAARMDETYSSQMSCYRNALSALTQIPLSRITTKLLFKQ